MTEHDPLPDELAELFAIERTAPVANASIRAALRTRIAPAATSLIAGKAAAATLLGTTGKTLAVLALTIAAGSGAVALVTNDDPRVAMRAEPPARVESGEPQPPVEPPLVVPPSVDVQPVDVQRPHVPTRRARAAAPMPAPQAAPPTQAQRLKTAWALLASSPARALELAREDEQIQATGGLTEERDALVIQALAKLHRTDEARAAATGFVVRYPDSIHRALVERVVTTEELP